MTEYGLIVIGTGSGLDLAWAAKKKMPSMKIAVVDKDDPGGICLTRGCIPSKLLIYSADVIRLVEKSQKFGIKTKIIEKDFGAVMERMHSLIGKDIEGIRQTLRKSKVLDYFDEVAEFTGPYTIKVGGETLSSEMFFLSTGSRPMIPPIEGLEKAGYLTSDSVLKTKRLPKSLAFIGGGYIAAEYGHFFSAMGAEVSIIEMTDRYLSFEEPEISALATRKMSKKATIITGSKVTKVSSSSDGKILTIVNREDGSESEVVVEEVFVAAGRIPNSDLLKVDKAKIETDEKGFIKVNEYLETSQPNIWAVGDANGNYLFRHVANHESRVVLNNVLLKNRMRIDYHAVPYAVFTYPEIAGVALKEKESIEKYGKDNVLIGFSKFEDTARGEAMGIRDDFVKILVERRTGKILGAHIIGPEASVLIQEIVNLMYTKEQNMESIKSAMHIHPALSEVVAKAFHSLNTPDLYHHILHEQEKLE